MMNMKKAFFTSLFLLLLGCSSSILLLDKPDLLKVISIIENDPLSTEARGAYSIIAKYVAKSKDVTVILFPEIPPIKGKYDRELLGSFIAGNLKSQLLTSVNENDSYSGLLLLFQTYNSIKKIDSSLTIAEIEKQIELHNNNRLQQYIDEIQNKYN